jgi:hypothetical protein
MVLLSDTLFAENRRLASIRRARGTLAKHFNIDGGPDLHHSTQSIFPVITSFCASRDGSDTQGDSQGFGGAYSRALGGFLCLVQCMQNDQHQHSKDK